MRKIILHVIPFVFIFVFLSGCGINKVQPVSASSDSPSPPKLIVKINNSEIPTVIRGYSWENSGSGTTTDAPSPISNHFQKYKVKVGEKAILSFDRKPKRIELTVFTSGKQRSKENLSGNSFNFPTKSGDYTYLITGHWSANTVNYNFEVHVK